MKKNRFERISMSGGLAGLLTNNPKKMLENKADELNGSGWNCVHFAPHSTSNPIVFVAQLLVLALTLGIWTWGSGYMMLFERTVD